GGLLEHLARRRTALAHIFVRLADAAAAGAGIVAPDALARDVLAGRGIFGRDLRPIAVELLGDELGKPGERALAHLGTRDADDHAVVRTHHDPGIDLGH